MTMWGKGKMQSYNSTNHNQQTTLSEFTIQNYEGLDSKSRERLDWLIEQARAKPAFAKHYEEEMNLVLLENERRQKVMQKLQRHK